MSLPSTPLPETVSVASSAIVYASPAATGAEFAPLDAVKLQVGPVVVTWPSLTVAYHSYSVPGTRPLHAVVVLEPEATPLFVPMTVNGAPCIA